MKKFTKLMLLLWLCVAFSSAYSQVTPNCVLGYPDNSNLPRSQVVFNESQVLAASQLDTSAGASNAVIKLWYTDEHALLLGIRRVVVKSSTGITTTDYPITATPSAPTCVVNPLVGSTVTSGDQVPNDVSAGGGRPIFPALFVTDLTVNGDNSRVGDWQQGGMPIPPSRVCGTWKSAIRTVDKTRSPALVTITTDANPPKNNTNLGGGSLPPGGLRNEGFTAEVFWNVSELGLIPGHRYRYQFMVHDGDQNKSGGDVGQSVFCSLMPGTPASLTLGNLVWLDINANNLNDATEPVIPNAIVKLYKDDNNDNLADGSAIATSTTNSNGLYSFTGLAAGNYIVGVIIPPSYQARLNGTVDPDNNLDNDNNGVNLIGVNQPGSEVRSNAITLSQSAEPTNDGDDNNGNLTLDFGMCPLKINLVLGNLVWNDFDGDGKRDLNEPAIGGITVSVYRDDNGDNLKDTDAPFATTTTNTQGFYSFTNLTSGRYIVSIPILAGYRISPNTSTQATSPFPDNDIDNDNNGVNVIGGILYSNAITLLAGTEPTTDGDDANGNLTLDMALCGNAFIGDFVWNDLNGNGIQDANEPGINGVTVNITFADGTTATTTTANFNGKDGYYDFKNLGPATYVVSFVTPTGLQPTFSNQGTDDTKDSDPVNGSVTVTLAANVSDFTIDAGFTASGISGLGNLVFIDLNYNGIRDLSEPGIPGATVNLYQDNNGDNVPDGPVIATTTTITDGSYKFTKLTADSYIVGVVLPSTSYAFNPTSNPLPNNDIDNDNNGVRLVGNEVRTNFITLSPGTEPTYDGDDNNTNSTLDVALKVNVVCRTPLSSIKNVSEEFSNSLSVYPNPAFRNFNLNIKSEKQGFGIIWIIDQNGRTVMSKNLMLKKGSNIMSLNTDNRMKSGVYTIQSVVDGKVLTSILVLE